MSSATSTDEPALQAAASGSRADDPGLRPWQFFLLAGMLSATVVVLMVSGQSPASIVVLSLTVVAASLVAIGVYHAFAPFVLPESASTPQLIVGRTRAAIEREKTLVLRAIKDLEFDFAMKKIGQGDFDDLSGRLRARAIRLMRQLDDSGGYRAEIEREITQRLAAIPAKSGAPLAPPASAPAADEDAPIAAATACTCGTTNDPDARFCKGCGSRLAAA